MYRDRPDKAWSLTDCISFEVMREAGLTDALTADEHFRQAGFRAVLLEEP
jgi:predicted nucleic acid-binding protein